MHEDHKDIGSQSLLDLLIDPYQQIGQGKKIINGFTRYSTLQNEHLCSEK